MDQYIGKLLDNRYEILELIGVGGMARVYKARCHRLNRLVALKILRDDLAQDAELRRRFHDESQAVAMLSHPNIVAVYDVSRSSDIEYIVMELIDGITLKQYMQKKGNKLNWREALHFITQIVKALGHAHSRGIIHRDIKPHNIMVLRDGSVKVADFGIARVTSGGHSTLTQEALGSVHYISPEQARGSHIDERSDLYSAGVVLYEMITGRLPFEGDTPVSVAIQHINSIPLSPREIDPTIPEALEAITMKAMAPNPDNRYPSADAMLADLEEFRKNPNINFDYSATDLLADTENDEPTRAIPVTGSSKRSGGQSSAPVRREEPKEYDDEDDDEDYQSSGRGRGSSLAPVLMGVGAFLVFFIGIGYFLWVTFFSGLLEPTEQYTVPNLMGKTLAEIQMDTSITSIFTIETGQSVFSSAPAGEIVGQTPLAGEKRKAGDLTIKVEVSAGQQNITMVDLAGKEYREAFLEIEKLGLKVDTPEYISSESVAKGYVVSFTPAEGTDLAPGDIVRLVVSTGPEEKKVTVISFVDDDIETAKKKIRELNLVIGEIKYEADMSMPGVVLGQSIKAGTEVVEGSFIDLVVSKGPDEEIPTEEPTATPPPESETPAPSPSSEPTDIPAVDPIVTPSPSPTPNNKSVAVDLGGGDGTVQVTITVGGKTVYDNAAGRNLGVVNIMIPGTGIQEVTVYLDGVVVSTQTIDFSA